MLTRSSSAATTSATSTETAEKQKSNSYFRRSTHSSTSSSANRGNALQDTVNYTSIRRVDPQTPVTESSSYISPGQRSRRSNEEILQEIYLRVEEQDNDDDADSFSQGAAATTLPELQNMVITTTTAAAPTLPNTNINTINNNNSCDLSVMTDDFHRSTAMHQPSRSNPFGGTDLFDIADDGSGGWLTFSMEEEPKRQPELNALFTFRRRDVRYDGGEVGEGTCTIFETTLNARTSGPDEESMEDLVKRLQQKGRASGVLKFNRGLIQQIRDGEKEVVFVLVQVKGSKFSKEEFGRMMASEVIGLTHERPIVVEIQTEDAVEGETLDVF